MKAFLQDIDLRESCTVCEFAKLPRYADFTLGDFWGVDKYYPDLNRDEKGTSLVLVHTNKGEKLLNKLSEKEVYVKECDLNKAIEGNPSILKHKHSNKNREKFFKELNNKNLSELINVYGKKSNIILKIKGKIKYFVAKIIRCIYKK